MVQIAAREQGSPNLIDEASSRNLTCSLEARLASSALPESSRVAFVGNVVWRNEENGDRNLHDEQVFLVREGRVRSLPLRADLASHSLDGLSWGYSGSGAAQLALAMLMEVLDDWQRVRRMLFVAKIPRFANWTADGSDILAWARELESTFPK
jgi:hypothetical protein